MEVNKIISHALQSMPPSKRQKAFAKDTSKLIHMGLNENNYGMSPKAVAALEDSMAGSHFYPDFAAVLLKQKVAEQYGLKAENVLTGAGSSAMIDMIGLTFLDDGAAFVNFLDWDRIDYLITDEKPSHEWLEFCEQMKIKLMY